MFYPRCFAVGTTKAYPTCKAFCDSDYDLSADIETPPVIAPHLKPSSIDVSRAQGQSYEYLLGLHKMGELHVAVSGKVMAIAAGKVPVFVHGVCSHSHFYHSTWCLSISGWKLVW